MDLGGTAAHSRWSTVPATFPLRERQDLWKANGLRAAAAGQSWAPAGSEGLVIGITYIKTCRFPGSRQGWKAQCDAAAEHDARDADGSSPTEPSPSHLSCCWQRSSPLPRSLFLARILSAPPLARATRTQGMIHCKNG